MIKLYPHQEEALSKMKNGCILSGEVGSGKSFTALFFYLKNYSDAQLYIITTAKKRDSNDWDRDCDALGINDYIVDSWNNIKRYILVKKAFFIFDEQRVVGSGAWTKHFIKISQCNHWILLSATPGDTWSDYIPVFIANRFYKNKTEFINKHVEYDRFAKYPKIKAYHNQGLLLRLRRDILVPMPFKRHTNRNHISVVTDYDKELYLNISETRFNPYTESPIENASEYVQVMRKIVATSQDRIDAAKFVISVHDKLIVFYNYNYELDILIHICEELGVLYYQWNGNAHEELPSEGDWIYLVQYTAGAEGWNCIETDSIMFYSPNYSYKIYEQAQGRIDRLNTEYNQLYYYNLYSKSAIDTAVNKALKTKTIFNQTTWSMKEGY